MVNMHQKVLIGSISYHNWQQVNVYRYTGFGIAC